MGIDECEYRIYCGGSFCFDGQENGFRKKALYDYRANLIGDVEGFLKPTDESGIRISKHVEYIGPFYFETENMDAEEIIKCESRMIERCTDAIFFLDTAACPGTITEMMYANSLNKRIHLFYIRQNENVETESSLHTPCWYPLLFCRMTNENVTLHPCSCRENAIIKISKFVELF